MRGTGSGGSSGEEGEKENEGGNMGETPKIKCHLWSATET